MPEVELSVAEWRKYYPQYSNVTDEQVEDLLIDATDYLDNTPLSVITNLDKRKRLIYLLAAHIAFLSYKDARGNGGESFVGRVGHAAQGSVSVSSGISNAPFHAEFFMQSPFGFMFWEKTKVYRMGRWFNGSPRCMHIAR